MSNFIDLNIENKKMRVFVAMPSSKTPPTRGIILVQEAFGVNSHIQDLAKRFANEGYAVIAPEVFHRTAPAGFTCGYTEFEKAAQFFDAITPETLIADCKACFEYLKAELHIQDISCVGYCLGGRTAFIVNSALPLRAAVAYYGGSISPNHLNLAAKQKAPLLLLWGGQDMHIPKEGRRLLADALSNAKCIYTEVEFSWAQHGFFCDERASYNKNAAEQAWALTLKFLNSPPR